MFRYVASTLAVLALLAFASPASAAPISSCGLDGSGNLACSFDFGGSTSGTIDTSVTTGLAAAISPSLTPDWFDGYSFLLTGNSYGGGSTGVSAVVAFSYTGASFYTSADGNFGAIVGQALGANNGAVQIVGTPFFSGALANGGVGLVNYGGAGWLLQGIGWPGGQSDYISVTDSGNPNPNAPVPEPATLTLLGVGGAVAGLRKWRASRKVA